MSWRTRGGALVVVLSCLAGCSGGGDNPEAGTSTTSSSVLGSQTAPGGAQGAGDAVPGPGGSTDGRNGTPGQAPPGQATPKPGDVTTTTTTGSGTSFPLTADVSPRCVVPGMVLTVSLTTRPHSSIAVTVAFSDNQSHGGGQIGTADRDGRWTWRKAVAPNVPLGPGQVIISAQDRSADSNDEGGKSTGESGTLIEKFEVKRTC